jgi:hypothetical protein
MGYAPGVRARFHLWKNGKKNGFRTQETPVNTAYVEPTHLGNERVAGNDHGQADGDQLHA